MKTRNTTIVEVTISDEDTLDGFLMEFLNSQRKNKTIFGWAGGHRPVRLEKAFSAFYFHVAVYDDNAKCGPLFQTIRQCPPPLMDLVLEAVRQARETDPEALGLHATISVRMGSACSATRKSLPVAIGQKIMEDVSSVVDENINYATDAEPTTVVERILETV